MADVNGRPARPKPHKWESAVPALSPNISPTSQAGNPAVAGLVAYSRTSPPASSVALVTLNALGGLLLFGGLFTMVVGMNRTVPGENAYSNTAAASINAVLQFASTSTLIVLIGGVALLLGGMALVGSLVVAAVKAHG